MVNCLIAWRLVWLPFCNVQLGGPVDPVCHICVGDTCFTSAAQKSTLDPSWNESAHFFISSTAKQR